MDDKYFIAAALLFVLLCWASVVAAWRSRNRRLDAWRETIKKDDDVFFINNFAERAYAVVIAVDRTKSRSFKLRVDWNGFYSEEWVEGKHLFPTPNKEGN